jgi:hypothetical protein
MPLFFMGYVINNMIGKINVWVNENRVYKLPNVYNPDNLSYYLTVFDVVTVNPLPFLTITPQ